MNPHRVRDICTECGRKTWANTRNGLRYSHTPPDSPNTCAGSQEPATARSAAGEATPEPAPLAVPLVTPTPPSRSGPGQSVRAFFAGLPGHGKRR